MGAPMPQGGLPSAPTQAPMPQMAGGGKVGYAMGGLFALQSK